MAEATLAILHVAPDHVDSRIGQGSHKDVAARKAYLQGSGHGYRYVPIKGDEPAQLEAVLTDFQPTHVLIEYSYYPRVARYLRRRFPGAYIAIRSINIEPLQHWTVADFESPADIVRTVYVCVRLFIADIIVGLTADAILPISPIEAKWYWPMLGFGRKVRWLPYIPPPQFRQAAAGERDVIACVPGVTSTRTRDQVNRFAAFAQAARALGWTQRFLITGTLQGWKVRLTPDVQTIGFVEDLPAFYRGVAAVAVLSPLGYGFKTTIADAIWSGARAIVHPAIHAELPDALKPHCMVLRRNSPAELAEVGAALKLPSDFSASIDALIAEFERGMDAFLHRQVRR